MANELLVQSPNDVWAWRAWAWVKFDQLKLVQAQHLQFAEILQELWTMPSILEEALLVEQISWQLVKHGYSLLKAGESFLPKLMTLFENAWFNRLEFAVQNTDVRSALLGLALKMAASWDLFIPFVRSFELTKSSLKDFEKEFYLMDKTTLLLLNVHSLPLPKDYCQILNNYPLMSKRIGCRILNGLMKKNPLYYT
jgi:hypothetical protein